MFQLRGSRDIRLFWGSGASFEALWGLFQGWGILVEVHSFGMLGSVKGLVGQC